MNTYPYQHIHSPYSILVYIGVHNGIGDTSKTCFCSVSGVDYACGVCAVKVVIASCCCCFHGITCIDFTIAGVVDGNIDSIGRIVMCFRLNDRVNAATCNNDVCIASIGTVGCDLDIAGGGQIRCRCQRSLRWHCVFVFLDVFPCFYGSEKVWREVRIFLVAWACQLSFAKFLMC